MIPSVTLKSSDIKNKKEKNSKFSLNLRNTVEYVQVKFSGVHRWVQVRRLIITSCIGLISQSTFVIWTRMIDVKAAWKTEGDITVCTPVDGLLLLEAITRWFRWIACSTVTWWALPFCAWFWNVEARHMWTLQSPRWIHTFPSPWCGSWSTRRLNDQLSSNSDSKLVVWEMSAHKFVMKKVCIGQSSSEQVEEEFAPPFHSFSKEWIVFHDLVCSIHSPHVRNVVDDAQWFPNSLSLVINFVKQSLLSCMYCRQDVNITLIMVFDSKKMILLTKDCFSLSECDCVPPSLLLSKGHWHSLSVYTYCATCIGVQVVQLIEELWTCIIIVHVNSMALFNKTIECQHTEHYTCCST